MWIESIDRELRRLLIGTEELEAERREQSQRKDQSDHVHAAGKQAADLPGQEGHDIGKAALVGDGKPG